MAAATALIWRTPTFARDELVQAVLAVTPRGYTWEAIDEMRGLSLDCDVMQAAAALGNGLGVTAPDTVPLCLWALARHAQSYEEALWTTVAALGDRDTTCAIVGGMCALAAGRASIPPAWLAAREPLAAT